MWTPGAGEIIVIVVAALLVFGPRKLPEMGKAIGSAVTEFKKGIAGKTDDDKKAEVAPAAEPKKIEEAESKEDEPAG